MQSLKNLFQEILLGDKEASRLAARQVRKVLFRTHYKDKIQTLRAIIENAPKVYSKIKEDWRQENFVMSVSILYFMRDDELLDSIYLWIFELLQHENGHIRYAAVRMLNNDLGPLTAHIRYPDSMSDHLPSPEVADKLLISLYLNLRNMSAVFYKSSYNRYKYVDSLSASPYKTVQMVISEMHYLCGNKYMKQLDNKVIELFG